MGLVKAFGGRRVVDGVSFSAGVGFTALMGPNGAGKTTTLSMVVGALRPDGGSVRVCGFDMWGRDGLRARRLLGYAPQDMPFKDKLSGYENLVWVGLIKGLGLFEAGREARRLLEEVGLYEHGGKRVALYSGGMRRKLAVAAALLGNPEALVLDEPTSGLDPVARADLWDLLAKVGRGRAVLFTTHMAEEAQRRADFVVIMHEGRVVAAGRPGELVAKYAPNPRVLVYADGAMGVEVEGARPREVGPGVYEYEVADASLWIPKLAEAYLRAGAKVWRIETREPGLEEVFFALTGRRL